MIRLFIGLALPAETRRRLTALQAGIPQAHWSPEDNLHLTLRFIGEVAEPDADALHDQLARITAPAFTLTLAGCGAFSSGHRARTLWIGVEPHPSLLLLHDKIESAALRAGQPPESRKYQPHITLARLRDPSPERVSEFIAGHNLWRESLPIDRFVLFSSHLGHGDPLYRIEADYPLMGQPPRGGQPLAETDA